tara:strand:+ start:362 stop:2077 length:1716 start_codon:yes stop_codon:yes gene_type:complete
MTTKDGEVGTPVGKVQSGDGKGNGAKTRKPQRVVTAAMRTKFGSFTTGLGHAGTMEGVGGNFYSPELSTDFLELPQSLHEQWNYYRFFYRSEPFVGQAVDLHTELPLSKIRIGIPAAQNRDIAEAATRFCTRWAEKVGLLQRLIAIVHEYHLIGEVFIWCEDSSAEMPREIREELRRTLLEDGEVEEEWVDREDADEKAVEWLVKNYAGWTSIRVLPPEQVKMESFNFTDERIFELIPDSKTKEIVEKAQAGDPHAKRVVESMPPEVVKAIVGGENIPLNTDPDAGSFIYYLANRKSDYDTRGRSVLERCMRVLVYRDKLRQAQTSIASRHMTPIRIVSGEDLDISDVDALREQVDMALQDPDYSIIANFPVEWNEMGADQRLLDLGTEYDLTDRQLYSGLGVTEGLLSGESSYSGDRINLEVINTRYMLLREQLQDLVEKNFFHPICARMGFVETDEDGEKRVVVPSLTFTRLALRDNRDTFDHLYNLYTKGSLDVDTILELLNLDPVAVREKIKRDLFTVNDPTFNEVMRGIYGDAGRSIAENSDVAEKISDNLGLKFEKAEEEGGGRF